MRVVGGGFINTIEANCTVRDVQEFLTQGNTIVTFQPLPGAAFGANFVIMLPGLADNCGYKKGDLCVLNLPVVIK